MSTSVQQTQQPASLRPFFGMAASYKIAPGSLQGDLKDDAEVLLDQAQTLLGTVTSCLEDKEGFIHSDPGMAISLLYSVKFQLDMIANLVAALEVRS